MKIFSKIKSRFLAKYYFLIDPFLKLIPVKKNEDIYFIFSEARGGSTWLAEILKKYLDASLVWEPLHPKRGVISNSYGSRPYFTEFNSEKLLLKLKDIFNGVIINSWTASKDKDLQSFYLGKKPRLIKFVRANKLLPYIFEHFNFKNKPILLIRHPASTFISQHKRFRKGFNLSNERFFFIDKDPKYQLHKDFIDSIKNDLQKEFSIFCLNNYHIYNDYRNYNCLTIFYEVLLYNPEQSLRKVTEEWNLLNTSDVDYRNPSSEASTEGIKQDFEKQITKWKSSLSNEDIMRFQEVLDYFEIKVYNMNQGKPQLD